MHSSDNQNGPHGPRASGNDPAHASASSTHPASARSTNTASAYPEAATDFLGLDQDVAAQPHDPNAAAQAADAPLDTSSSWLLSIEEGGAPAANSGSTSPFVAGQATVDAPERMLEPEWQTSAEPESSANDGEVAPDALETPPARKPRSRAPLYALAACALLATGGWYGWKWWQARQPASTPEIARAPTPTPPPAKAPAAKPKTPRVKPPETASANPSPAVAAATTTPSEPAPAMAATPEPATSTPEPSFAFGPRSTDARVAEYVRDQLGQGLPADDASAPGTVVPELSPLATLGRGTFFPGAGSAGFPANSGVETTPEDTSFRSPSPSDRTTKRTQGRGTLRIASAGDLAGIWDGSTIPLDAVDKDAKLLTPQIGRVRATIHGGEIFEGRLYAVGQKQFYLDTDLGRMALHSAQIAKIEQLSSPDGTAALGTQGSQYLNGLPRVRVRTPGGMLYGKVIGRDDTSLTLITDGGARIRVDATDFEPAPDTNAIIVRSTRRTAP